MKTTRNYWLGVAIVATCLAAGKIQAQSYVLTDLGAPGETESYAAGINLSNIVVGYSVHASGMTNRAWVWPGTGSRIDLGGFGGQAARALAVNDAGQIAGYATDAGEVAHGFRYDVTNGLVDLGTPPVAGSVYPQAINAQGQIAGYITTTSNSVPFLWRGPGDWFFSGTLPGADSPASAFAYALNNDGILAGSASWIFGGSRAFVTETNAGILKTLNTLGGETGVAYGINNLGQTVGEVETTNGAQHAFLLDVDTIHDLGTLGGADSTAVFVDDLGDIVGSSTTSNNVQHAFIWNPVTGLEDLQKFIAPNLGWELNEAHALNVDGFIVGSGTFAGLPRAFLLAPRSGTDTNAPAVIAQLTTNFLGSVNFSAQVLTLNVWDDIRVEASTLNSSCVRVTGPNGYNVLAPLGGRSPATNALQILATFQLNPPGGVWDGADTGLYTISLEPNKVRDIAGNYVPAQSLATLTVAIQTNLTVAAAGPGTLLTGGSGNFTFNVTSSFPSAGANDIHTFAFDWDGNGSTDETQTHSSPFTIAHTFNTLGYYNVGVTITDSHGKSLATNVDVFVNAPSGSGWTSLAGPGTYRSGGSGFYAQGKLFYLGGDPLQPLDGGDSQVNYYSLATGLWASGSVLNGDYYGPGAGQDNLNRIAVFGGHTFGALPTASGFTYTTSGGQGGGIASRALAQNGFAWCADNLNRLYSIGGGVTNVYRYSGSGNTWTALAGLPVVRTGAAAVYDGQGRILVIGGGDAQVFAYNIAANSWSQLANAPKIHSGQGIALASNGLVYVLNADSSVMVFDPIRNVWGSGPSAPNYHDSLVAGTNGLLYAFGGIDELDVLNPANAGIAPFFTSTPTSGVLTGHVNQAWSYQALAGGNLPPNVFLVNPPAGMTITAAGLLNWTPGSGQTGQQAVTIRATNSFGVAQQNFIVNIGAAFVNNDTQAPVAVTNLVASNITDTGATLTWNPTIDNVGVAGYRLYTYVRKSSGFKGIHKYTVNVLLADNLNATTISRSGLLPGYTYTFGIAAFDAAGNESPHTKVSFITLSPPRIIPGGITAQSLNYAIVGEPWRQQFSVMGNPAPALSFVSGPSGMSFSNNAVIWNPVQGGAGTNTISFTLHAANAVTNFDQSFPVTVYPAGTDLVPPTAATGVQITEVGADHVGLRWSASTDNYGIAGYWVTATMHYRARWCARGCQRSRLITRQFFAGTNTTAIIGGLEPGAVYYVSVQAVDTAGNNGYMSCPYTYGGYCSSVSFTTTPLLAANLATLPNGNLLFSWTELQPLYYRVGDYYAYTVIGNQTFSTNIAPWMPLPGITWPVTNTSIEVPPSSAVFMFYKVKAEYLVQP